jgi:hypothetical protein
MPLTGPAFSANLTAVWLGRTGQYRCYTSFVEQFSVEFLELSFDLALAAGLASSVRPFWGRLCGGAMRKPCAAIGEVQ